MKPAYRTTLGDVISKKLRKFPPLKLVPVPPGGWLRAIRMAVGMPASYAAKRTHLTQQGFSTLEKSEAAGTITLNSLRRAAEAIQCDLVYAVVPRQGSLKKLIERQATSRARKAILPVSHSMHLESQGSKPGPKVVELARRLAAKPSRALWTE
jgi:predicted DNA-binding mobile mystery protein A